MGAQALGGSISTSRSGSSKRGGHQGSHVEKGKDPTIPSIESGHPFEGGPLEALPNEEGTPQDRALQDELNALWGIDASTKRRRTRRKQFSSEEKQEAAALEAWKKMENAKID